MKKLNRLLSDLERLAENNPEDILNLTDSATGQIKGGNLVIIENGVCGGTNPSCHNGLCDGNGTSNGTCSNDNC